MKIEALTLLNVGNKIEFHAQALEGLKERLPDMPTKDLVDGFVAIKDTGKKIDTVTKLVREEILNNRFEQADRVDEKGHQYYSGDQHELKLERRISKPKLRQEEAYKFFNDKGLLHKVADIEVSLSTEDIESLISAAKLLGTDVGIISQLFKSVPKKSAKELLHKVVTKIQAKGTVTINIDKVSALIELEELSVDDVEHLFDVSETYAFKAK